MNEQQKPLTQEDFIKNFIEPTLAHKLSPDAMMVCVNSWEDVRVCTCQQCNAIRNWNKTK